MQRALTQINLQLTGHKRAFFIRNDSHGDRGVINQIFRNLDYDLSPFAQTNSLKSYYSSKVASKKVPLIVDAGANIGASAVYFSHAFPESKILAIEPEENNCDLLRKNCAGLNLALIEGGVGCNNGVLFLTDPGRSDWAFRLGEQGNLKVPVFAADELVMDQINHGLEPFIFKIDIEGGESELFRERTVWMQRFPLLIIELHDWLLPGTSNSRNFLRAVSTMNYDLVFRGENIFCFNNDLLSPHH
jgi:FkbM family methyltransferase